MMDYELEYLKWKERQLKLRQKYADTPPGLDAESGAREQEKLKEARALYEERRRWRLVGGGHIPPEPFVGRRRELAAIQELFENGTSAVFLCGMGGIGKTALARVWARKHAGEYDHILFLTCVHGIGQALADDGQLAISNMAYTEDRYSSRKQYIREKYEKLEKIVASERILMILDNHNSIDDPWLDILENLPCRKLITTRLSRETLSGQGRAAVEVGSLTDEEDWRGFYRLYTGEEPSGPLWEAAVAYRDLVLGHTLKMKLTLCNPRQTRLDQRTAKSILANFRLKKSERTVLCELTFISLAGIPEEVFLSCTCGDRESLDRLKSYSLVQERSGAGGETLLSLHPVIDEAVRFLWKPNLNRCAAFLQAFGFYIRFTWFRPRKGDLWLADQIFFLLDRLPEPAAWYYYIYDHLATALFVWEYFSEAERLMRKTYEAVRDYYGPVHQACAHMALRMAAVYHNQMRFPESRKWYELACRLFDEAKPQQADFYLNKAEACEKLARLMEYDGNYEEGHRYVDEAFAAMEEFRRRTEKDQPGLWNLRRNRQQYVYLRRARLYFRQGRLQEAQTALNTALSMFPVDELEIVEFHMLQVQLHLALGQWEQAYVLAGKNLETMLFYHGETIKDTLSCREQLGDVLAASGQVSKANEQYIRAAAVLQEKYPHQTGWIERLREKALRITDC